MLGLYLGPQEERGSLEALFGARWTLGVPSPAALPGLLGRLLASYRRH